MNRKLEELQRVSNDTTFYWYSDIPALLGENTPSFSTFRRRVREGAIHTVDVGGREAAFKAEDVQLFVAGKLTKPRGEPGEESLGNILSPFMPGKALFSFKRFKPAKRIFCICTCVRVIRLAIFRPLHRQYFTPGQEQILCYPGLLILLAIERM